LRSTCCATHLVLGERALDLERDHRQPIHARCRLDLCDLARNLPVGRERAGHVVLERLDEPAPVSAAGRDARDVNLEPNLRRAGCLASVALRRGFRDLVLLHYVVRFLLLAAPHALPHYHSAAASDRDGVLQSLHPHVLDVGAFRRHLKHVLAAHDLDLEGEVGRLLVLVLLGAVLENLSAVQGEFSLRTRKQVWYNVVQQRGERRAAHTHMCEQRGDRCGAAVRCSEAVRAPVVLRRSFCAGRFAPVVLRRSFCAGRFRRASKKGGYGGEAAGHRIIIIARASRLQFRRSSYLRRSSLLHVIRPRVVLEEVILVLLHLVAEHMKRWWWLRLVNE